MVKLSAALGSYMPIEGAKSKAGSRSIPLFSLLRVALVRLRETLIVEYGKKDDKGNAMWDRRVRPRPSGSIRPLDPVHDPLDKDCWLLPNRAGHVQSPDNQVRAYKQLLARSGLPTTLTIHGLRHDFATLLAELGTPQHVTMKLIGHSKPSMLTDYQNATDAAGRAAMDRLNGYLEDLG